MNVVNIPYGLFDVQDIFSSERLSIGEAENTHTMNHKNVEI